MDFKTRFHTLNDHQQTAVTTIDGPLLVVAGPGTGKTELLSMRAANILRRTDMLPSNILCLTFTDSGAANMRERLRQIIGEQAYKVAIHTFHSFGVEIINQNREYFFRGSEYQPADELSQYTILRSMFDELDRTSLLATQNQGEYTYLSDIRSMISEFKKSGLTSDELRRVITSNQTIIETITPDIAAIFASKITKAVIDPFVELAQRAASLDEEKLPVGVSSYVGSLSLSLAHAAQEALETGKTNAITAWKKQWCKQDTAKTTVLKDSLYVAKLQAAIDLYEIYHKKLDEAKLYDYDDMILNVIQAITRHPDLHANLTETYQYIMVDEFQDTNLAQLRLLFSLTDYDKPNVMVVGDDDQAIFSFQGADVGNIQRFRDYYQNPEIIVLTDNYRSDASILEASRAVIVQGEDRLEHTTPGLSKELTPHALHEGAHVTINQYITEDVERAELARTIAELITSGVPAESIAVLARQHDELIATLPHLAQHAIAVNYERRDNALDNELVKLVERLARVIVAIRQSHHEEVNSLLPELIAHPAWGFAPISIWKLSLQAWRNHEQWLETMLTTSEFSQFAEWLISLSISQTDAPLEEQIDQLVGIATPTTTTDNAATTYYSPLRNFFFSAEALQSQPDSYLDALEALRTVRDKLREHTNTETPSLEQFVSLLDTYQQMNARLGIVRNRAEHQLGHVNLTSTHKAKGLEFDHVFVIGATDARWGEKARGKSRNIPYPANLPLQPVGNTYDERLRLFFVAMTRAKKTLTISHSKTDKSGRPTLIASFLSSQSITTPTVDSSLEYATIITETDWHDRLTRPMGEDLRSLLSPTLEQYKLSATHLNNFLDVSRGGPQTFLLNNLLRFPQTKSAKASLGTAIHAALQFVHNTVRSDGKLPDTPRLLDEYSTALRLQRLSSHDYEQWNDYGRYILEVFVAAYGATFSKSQHAELNFAGQSVVIHEARLTGTLDLVDIDTQKKTIRVTDYKTGKPARDWKGSTDYDKIKLHKYRQQLMFYQLLVEHSRDYADYSFLGGTVQFVEPDTRTGEILALEDSFSAEDLARFRQLISAVWQKITTLELPDVSEYTTNYAGMLQFEDDLLTGVV